MEDRNPTTWDSRALRRRGPKPLFINSIDCAGYGWISGWLVGSVKGAIEGWKEAKMLGESIRPTMRRMSSTAGVVASPYVALLLNFGTIYGFSQVKFRDWRGDVDDWMNSFAAGSFAWGFVKFVATGKFHRRQVLLAGIGSVGADLIIKRYEL